MGQPPLPSRKPGSDDADPAADPSMDDILASIRRILDDDAAAKPASGDVLMLDASMMVDDAAGEPPSPEPPAEPPSPQPDNTPVMAPVLPVSTPPVSTPPVSTQKSSASMDSANDPPFVAPAAPAPSPPSPAGSGAEAAAQSVGTLMRTLAAERRTVVGRAGITLEDLVREEMRPLLTAWLDAHLPPIVERAVQAEIERIVARQAG